MSLILSARIKGLFVGNAQDRWPGKPPSAISKSRVSEPQEIGFNGLQRDCQADLTVHGGKEKAIHHYAFDHYANWIAEGYMPPATQAAAFGENVSTIGLTEDNLCIGDILTMGSATVQISQGRQPCWKLGLHTGRKTMPYLFQKTGRTGWYYRVLETGCVSPGDRIALIERPQPIWSVRQVTQARLTKRISPEGAAELADVVELAEGWRRAFVEMAAGNLNEDTSERLRGP